MTRTFLWKLFASSQVCFGRQRRRRRRRHIVFRNLFGIGFGSLSSLTHRKKSGWKFIFCLFQQKKSFSCFWGCFDGIGGFLDPLSPSLSLSRSEIRLESFQTGDDDVVGSTFLNKVGVFRQNVDWHTNIFLTLSCFDSWLHENIPIIWERNFCSTWLVSATTDLYDAAFRQSTLTK